MRGRWRRAENETDIDPGSVTRLRPCDHCGLGLDPTSPKVHCVGPGGPGNGVALYRCEPCWQEGVRPYLAILAALQDEYDREAIARHRRIVEVLA